MRKKIYDVVICGAGIAGISSAYYLSRNHNINDILIVDERPPLSLTSDKSTECYRNWWPGPDDAMVKLMNRSIDLLEELAEESGNIFHLNRRGYLYVTGDKNHLDEFQKKALEPSNLGAGPLRIHHGQPDDPVYTPIISDGFRDFPDGADLFLDQSLIAKYFPYLSDKVRAALHIRRAGWFSAQQFGMFLLDQARSNGVALKHARVTRVNKNKDCVTSITLGDGEVIHTPHFVNAAGPYLRRVGELLGDQLPVHCELHQKAAFKDSIGAIPRDAPLLVWDDPQTIDWSDEEREFLSDQQETQWMLGKLPAGAHMRPEGGAESQIVLILWEYKDETMEPAWPPKLDPLYPEIALRGLVRMQPKLRNYIGKLPRFILDGGYYTKTRENRPLIGPLSANGSFVIGALSGFGLMAACAAAELLAANVTKSSLPDYAQCFSLDRYSDPQYLSLLAQWGDSGQL